MYLTTRSSTLSSTVSSLSSAGISLSRMDDKTEDNRLQQHKVRPWQSTLNAHFDDTFLQLKWVKTMHSYSTKRLCAKKTKI